jgi:hypothetical protein
MKKPYNPHPNLIADVAAFDRLMRTLPAHKVARLKAAAARCAFRHPDLFLDYSARTVTTGTFVLRLTGGAL